MDPAFENRLRKMARHHGKWARRQGITCYRIYDRDVPGFPLAIDLYEGWVHAQMFERGDRAERGGAAGEGVEVDEGDDEDDGAENGDGGDDGDGAADGAAGGDDGDGPGRAGARGRPGAAARPGPGAGAGAGAAPDRQAALVAVIARVLEVDPGRVVLKGRRRQRGFGQYQRLAEGGREVEAREAGLRFVVNLHDHLDTGLFLDHRQTRAMVGALARDARFLNLFCYTGSFTVYAAAGGARSTTSVDLSQTYLDWAAQNLARNDLADPQRHRFVRADATTWLADEARRGARYDLIVCDPPTFSRSKRMRAVFDVRRHHAALIRACAGVLDRRGTLLFSTNARRFHLDVEALGGDLVARDITGQTLPRDFEARGAHRTFRVRWADAAP